MSMTALLYFIRTTVHEHYLTEYRSNLEYNRKNHIKKKREPQMHKTSQQEKNKNLKAQDEPMVQVQAQSEESAPQSVVSERVLKSIEKNFHR